MNQQISASFKKEKLAFFRTKRLLMLILIVVGWGILGPVLLRGLGVMIDSLTPVYDDLGMDVSGMTQILATYVSTGVASSISDITSVGLIAFLLMINSFAGGEQKKRSIMIPRTSGLRSTGYLLPKYIIYPLTALILAIVAAFASWGASVLVFEINDVAVGGVLSAGLIAGVCLMFYICIHLTLGTATGRAGMSSVLVIIVSLLVPGLFSVLGSDYIYNPFLMGTMAVSAISGDGILMVMNSEIVMTLLIALVLMVIFYFLALFAQNAKKIDNSGNEIKL
ncbi:MAG: hypothetical protein FWC75_04440 [Oscillospiraceae bacterium]|nr:hypothetical protein [Oscillospiraceae bacterium]